MSGILALTGVNVVQISQTNSQNNNLIQVADYVAGIAAKITKNKETPLNGEFLRWPA